MKNAAFYRSPDDDVVGLAGGDDAGGAAVDVAPENTGVAIETGDEADTSAETPEFGDAGDETDTPAADEPGETTKATATPAAEGADADEFAQNAAEYLEFQSWKASKQAPADAKAPAGEVANAAAAPALPDVKAIEAETQAAAAKLAKVLGFGDADKDEVAAITEFATVATKGLAEVAKLRAEIAAEKQAATQQAEVQNFYAATREALDLVIDEIGAASIYGAKGANQLPSQRQAFEAFSLTLNSRARELRALQGGKPLTAEQVKAAAKAVHADLVQFGKAKGTAAPKASKPAPKLPMHAPANGVKGVRPSNSKSEEEAIEAAREAAYQRIQAGLKK